MTWNMRCMNASPFDPVAKRSEADIENNGQRFTVVKGAPQVVIDLCALDEAERRTFTTAVDEDAAKGYRTLGVARADSWCGNRSQRGPQRCH